MNSLCCLWAKLKSLLLNREFTKLLFHLQTESNLQYLSLSWNKLSRLSSSCHFCLNVYLCLVQKALKYIKPGFKTGTEIRITLNINIRVLKWKATLIFQVGVAAMSGVFSSPCVSIRRSLTSVLCCLECSWFKWASLISWLRHSVLLFTAASYVRLVAATGKERNDTHSLVLYNIALGPGKNRTAGFTMVNITGKV